MRMDRYKDNTINDKIENDNLKFSRLEKNKTIYNNAYDSSKVIDFDDFFGVDKSVSVNNDDNDKKNEVSNKVIEKNYDVEEYLKKAHNNFKNDANVRNLDNSEFKNQENEIQKLIASIDEQKESNDFFSDLIGDDENTMVEGQLTTEEFTKTTYEEFYENEVKNKKISELGNTKLEKALSDETMAKLELEEEEINKTFQDIFKTSKISKKKKKKLAIIVFSISLFVLILVILFLIIM